MAFTIFNALFAALFTIRFIIFLATLFTALANIFVSFCNSELSRTVATAVDDVNYQNMLKLRSTFHSVQPLFVVTFKLMWPHRGHVALLS